MKKVMFRGIGKVLRCAIKTSTGCLFMLCVLQLSLFAGTAHSQERDSGAYENHKFLYGIHVGLTDNEFVLYRTNGGLIASQDGTLHTDGSHHYYAYGFRLAVIGEAQLGRCFSLRVMPGVSQFSACMSRLKSTRGELPVDVKFHPVRMKKLRPYLTSGIGYGYDFASLRDDGSFDIKAINAHDLRYSCGMGVDWYTRLVRVGIELKAGFGLLSTGEAYSNASYFHNGTTFCLGINIEG